MNATQTQPGQILAAFILKGAGLLSDGWRYLGCHGGDHRFQVGTQVYRVDLCLGKWRAE